METGTARADVLKWLLEGNTLTQDQCKDLFGSTRLAGLIWVLRKEGNNIHTHLFDVPTRYKRKARIAVYSMDPKKPPHPCGEGFEEQQTLIGGAVAEPVRPQQRNIAVIESLKQLQEWARRKHTCGDPQLYVDGKHYYDVMLPLDVASGLYSIAMKEGRGRGVIQKGERASAFNVFPDCAFIFNGILVRGTLI